MTDKHPKVTRSDTEPAEPEEGTIWQDTSRHPNSYRLREYGKWVSLDSVPPRWREYASEDQLETYDDAEANKSDTIKQIYRRGVLSWIEEQVWCPLCGHRVEVDDYEDLITYHGDEGVVEVECEHCEAEFLVNECVRRTYHSHRVWEGACDFGGAYRLDLDYYSKQEG